MTKQKELLFKIDVKTLLDLTKILKEFLTEVRFNLNNGGLEITELDPANICLIDIELKKDRFIQITEQQKVKTYGINIEWLSDVLKENKKENVEIITQDKKLYLKFDNGINSEVSLIDIEGEKTNTPNSLEFKTEIIIDSKRLKEILKHFCSISEGVVFNSLSDGFKIYSEKSLNDSEIKLNLDEVKISGKEVKSKYTTEFLSKFIKTIFSEKTVLKFAEDHPLRFEQEEENLKVVYILAPRVTDED